MNTKVVIKLTLLLGVLILFPFFTTAEEKISWYDPAWSYRQKITVDQEQVSSTVTTFPVLVRIDKGPIVNNAQSDGDESAIGAIELLGAIGVSHH